jgi:hypothetical protein
VLETKLPTKSLLFVLCPFALPLIKEYLKLRDVSVALIGVVTLLLAVAVLAIVTLLRANAKRKTYQKWIDNFDGEITFNEIGIFITKQGHKSSIAWRALTKIELAWCENPFGDPQFGAYCDTDWLLWSTSGNALRITESVNELNSKILVEAFTKHLSDFNFDYEKFKDNNKSRLFDLQGGKVTAWMRT